MRYIYLHGFASGPLSRKAQFFHDRFAEAGLELHVPALDAGDFRNLTITSQLAIIDKLAPREPAVLIGSSLGGYVASLYATAHESVQKLVLLAPGFRCAPLWEAAVGEASMQQWRQSGAMSVFHYSHGCERELGYQFIEDARRYDLYPDFRQPGLIIHGVLDDMVPVAVSEHFAATHPNVRLVTVNSGHALTDALDTIWNETAAFLHLQR